jgi:hypothetical protein
VEVEKLLGFEIPTGVSRNRIVVYNIAAVALILVRRLHVVEIFYDAFELGMGEA